MKNLIKSATILYCFILFFSVTIIPHPARFAQVNQERWAYEYASGIQGVHSPFFGKNIDLPVSSSWNEPRSNEIHKGVDQAASLGTNVGPMYETARVLVNQTINGGGNTQVIRYYNFETGKTFYSVYMHLSAYVKANNTVVYPSDVTAKTGNTGLNCTNGCYHLHYELLDSISVTELSSSPYFTVNFDSRVGVNPATHMTPYSAEISETTWKNLSVFKQPSVSGRRLTISAMDSSNDGNNQLNYMKIYFKANDSIYYAVADMTKTSSDLWFYDFASDISYVDYFVVGRRSTSERWVSYPVKVYNLGNAMSGISPSPNQSGYVYDTIHIAF